jgi:hypothetical protein
MRRLSLVPLTVALVLALATPALAAPKSGCPNEASGWQAMSPSDAAEMFFPHLWPGPFPTVAALEADIRANYDQDGDDSVCIKLQWGEALNPNSHWYRIGIEGPLAEPVWVMLVTGNNANGGS